MTRMNRPSNRRTALAVSALALACLALAGGVAAAEELVPMAAPATLQQASVSYTLDPNGTSHVAWLFTEPSSEWANVTGSECHESDDFYAMDLNWGIGAEDRGKLALAMAPGHVIYAGRRTAGSGYGNQVVVQIVDENNNSIDWAYRYAHLDTLAVRDGDYVHFGSEIGTVGSTGTQSPHLHAVLYKDIYAQTGTTTGVENLYLGFSPSANIDCEGTLLGPSGFAADYAGDGDPFWWNSENLPCSTWNDDPVACNSHSILYANRVTQDCAYYSCSDRCAPRGTSNCLAGCESYCDAFDAQEPCHTWNRDRIACDDHALQPGGTRDCAYYLDSHLCRPRGTSNCLAGITAYCFE